MTDGQRPGLAIVVAVLAVLVVGGGISAGIVAGGTGGGQGGRELDANGWLVLAALVAGPLVVVAAIVYGILRWRRPRAAISLLTPSPLLELPDRRSRNALVRSLRRAEPIAPERRELARRVVQDTIGRRWLAWLYLAIAVVQGANAAVGDDLLRWIQAATAAVLLLLAGYMGWLVRRMRVAGRRLDVEPTP